MQVQDSFIVSDVGLDLHETVMRSHQLLKCSYFEAHQLHFDVGVIFHVLMEIFYRPPQLLVLEVVPICHKY